MAKFVVSANYLDRSDKVNRWLVRREDEPLSAVQKVASLVATNVEFKSTGYDDPEDAYGCTVLAICDEVEFVDEAPKLAYDVRFNHMFIACSHALSGVSKLSLDANGSITADGIVIDDEDKWDYDRDEYVD